MSETKSAIQMLKAQGVELNRAQLVSLRNLSNQEINRQQTYFHAHENPTESDLSPSESLTDSITALDKKALLLIKNKIQQINPTLNRLLQI